MAIKKCKECGREVSTSAKQCPHCGKQHPTGGLTLPAKIGVGVIVLGVLGNLVGRSGNPAGAGADAAAAAEPAEAPVAPSIPVTANRLFRDYQANEVAADNRYKHHLLRVTGVVDGIKKDVMDNTYLVLQTPNEFMSVHATLASAVAQSAASLSRGDQITLLCKGAGMIMGSPMLDDCHQ